MLAAIQPLTAQSASESDRLEKLERAVEQLQKRNAELEAEVGSLKESRLPLFLKGKFENKGDSRRKNVRRKSRAEREIASVYVLQRGPELKLVLGGFIQVNFEDSDAFAFERKFWSERNQRPFQAAPGADQSNRRFCGAIRFQDGRRFWPERWHQQQPHRIFGHRHLAQLASVSCGANQDRPI